MSSNNKRNRVDSPVDNTPPTPSALLQRKLDDLVASRRSMRDFFLALSVSSPFYLMADPAWVDCSQVPAYYLPDGFARRIVGGETRLVFGKHLLSSETLRHVVACIKTTATSGVGYFLDDDGCALVIPRSSIDPTGVSFEYKRIKFVKDDVQQPDLLRLVAFYLQGVTPSASKALYLVNGLRDVHRAQSSGKVFSALSTPPGSTPQAHLATLLGSTERHVASLASNLLSCMLTPGLLEDLLRNAETGDVEIHVIYNIVSGFDLSLPIRNFTMNQGYDRAGRALTSKKLSECDDDDEVITSKTVVTLQNFKTLSDDTPVFVKPETGVYRKGPRRDKCDTYVEMAQVVTTSAAKLRKYARAIQGARGGQRDKQVEEKVSDDGDLASGEL